jgi:hypothetical protein
LRAVFRDFLDFFNARLFCVLLRGLSAYDGAPSGDWIAFVVICVSGGGSTVSLLMGSGDHNAGMLHA